MVTNRKGGHETFSAKFALITTGNLSTEVFVTGGNEQVIVP